MNRSYLRSLVTGLALLLITGCTSTGNDLFSGINRFNDFTDDIKVAGQTMSVKEAMEHYEVNGITVIGIFNGVAAGFEYHGVENAITRSTTDQNSVYQAASLSKMVVGLAMAQADRNGLIDLDRSLSTHVSQHLGEPISGWYSREFLGSTGANWAQDISLRRLLQNTAGLDRPTTGTSCSVNDTAQKVFIGTFTRPCTKCVRCETTPGTDYSYSSGGFVVAEAMFEEASGRGARNYLNIDVLEPYGLLNSTFKNASSSIANLTTGCDSSPFGNGLCECTYEVAKVKFPGGMLANPADYARILTLIMNDGAERLGGPVIDINDIRDVIHPAYHKNSSLHACTANTTCLSGEQCIAERCINPLGNDDDWYGMGVHMKPTLATDGYPKELFHKGSQPGYSSYFNIDRESKDGVVVFINGSPDAGSSGRNALLNNIITAFKDHYR